MFSRNSLTYYLVTVVAIAAGVPEYNAFADDSAEQALDEVSTFDIPEQSLDAALLAFSEQADVQIVMAAATARDLDSSAVTGEQSNRRALEQLLDNRGLSYTEHRHRTIAVHVVQQEQGGDSEAKNSGPSPTPALMAQNRMPSEQSREGQTNQAIDDEDERVATRLEEIVVTGSRIRGAEGASPIVTISREKIDLAGFATVEEVIENLPQNFGAGATSDATQGDNNVQAVGGVVNNSAGGTSINLRGLGAGATLVLLNGRRVSPSGFRAGFTNIASIPVTAIERVEVLTDGASAIHGSDAIAGVVNFILREDYEGAETRLRYGSDTGGDTSDVQFGQTFGTSWGNGNILFSYEHFDREPLASADRAFTASNDLSPFGGTDRRQPGGNPANILIGSDYYAIPEGQDGTSLVAIDFDPSTPRNVFNAREFDELTAGLDQHSGFLYVRQNVGALEFFGTARYSRQESRRRDTQGVIDFTVTGNDPATPEIEGNPWFVDPTGTGLTSVRVDNYLLDKDFGPMIRFGEIESTGATLGARLEFSDRWRGELTLNWSEEEGRSAKGNEADFSMLHDAVNLADPDLAFNPFGDGSNTSSAVIEALVNRGLNIQSDDENELTSASFDVIGEAFEMYSVPVNVAAGVDYREESLLVTVGEVGEIETDLERDILAVYGEVFLPLVGDEQRRPWLERLEVSMAARYEDYSDFGSNTSPKLGLVWSPTESLTIRGTVGSSYRAPALTDLDDTNVPQNRYVYYPAGFFGLTPVGVLVQGGQNADLGPEEADTWTAGFQWTPERADGLSLKVDYFNIEFTGQIERPSTSSFAALDNPRFASIVTRNPSGDQIAAVVNQPNFDPDILVSLGFGSFPAEDLISGVIPVAAIVDNRLTNLARSVVTGTDIQLSYAFDTVAGSFNVGLNGSYLFDFERQLISTDPLFEEVDNLGRPVDFRARGSVGWNRGRWFLTGFVNYTDGYTDNISSPERAVDSWTTVDFTIGYNTGSDAGLLGDIRLSLTTQNLFDEAPPFVDTVGGVGYDASNANPLGRFLAFQLSKDW